MTRVLAPDPAIPLDRPALVGYGGQGESGGRNGERRWEVSRGEGVVELGRGMEDGESDGGVGWRERA